MLLSVVKETPREESRDGLEALSKQVTFKLRPKDRERSKHQA